MAKRYMAFLARHKESGERRFFLSIGQIGKAWRRVPDGDQDITDRVRMNPAFSHADIICLMNGEVPVRQKKAGQS